MKFTFWIMILVSPLALQSQPTLIHQFNGYSPYPINKVGNLAYFIIDSELWVTDGNSEGTRKVTNMNYNQLINFNNNFYYTVYDQQIVNGTVKQTTSLLKIDLNSGATDTIYSAPSIYSIVHDDSWMYFISPDNNSKEVIYKSDGTKQNTDSLNLKLAFNSGKIEFLIPFQGKLIYTKTIDMDSQELWMTDGIVSSKILGNEFTHAFRYGHVFLNNKIFFNAYDDIHGLELWETDLTPAGTHLLIDITPGSTVNYPYSSYPSDFSVMGNQLFFTANSGTELWTTQGTPQTTLMLKKSKDYNSISRLAINSSLLFFSSFDSNQGTEPWVSDGTVEGTVILKDIFEGINSSINLYSSFFPAGSFEFIIADNGINGNELWAYDMISQKIGLVEDLVKGPSDSRIGGLTELNNQIIFFTTDVRGERNAALFKLNLGDISLKQNSPHPEIFPSETWTQFIGTDEPNIGSTRLNFNYDMAVGPQNEIVLSGLTQGNYQQFFQNNISLPAPSSNLLNGTSDRHFVSKFQPTGELVWSKQLSATGAFFRKNNAVDVASDGSVYFATSMQRASATGELILNEAADGYLVKFDADGNQQWVNPFLTGQNLYISQVKTDKVSNVYTAGLYFLYHMSYGGKVLRSERSPSYFLSKTSSEGKLLWSKTLPDTWDDYGDITHLEVDEKNGRVVLLLSNGLRNTTSSCEYQNWPARLICLDFDANIIWEQTVLCSDLMIASSFSIGPYGEIFVVGRYRGTFKAGDYSITSNHDQNCSIETGFLLKVDKSGKVTGLESENPLPVDFYDIQFLSDGTYVIAGTEQTGQTVQYPNYPAPFPSSNFQLVVNHFDYVGNLLHRKAFNRTMPYEFYYLNPIMRVDQSENIIISDRGFGKFDSVYYSPTGGSLNLVLLKTKLSSSTKSYSAETVGDLVQLFPVPSDQYLFLKIWREFLTNQDFTVSLLDVQGREVLRQELNSASDTFIFETGALSAGLYVFKLKSKDYSFLRKIIIRH